jgi:hypothetical protein
MQVSARPSTAAPFRGKVMIKHRLVAHKLLVALMDGQYSWLQKDAPGTVTIRLGPASRFLRVSNSRFRDQLRWLEAHGYLAIADLRRGQATVQLRLPTNLSA